MSNTACTNGMKLPIDCSVRMPQSTIRVLSILFKSDTDMNDMNQLVELVNAIRALNSLSAFENIFIGSLEIFLYVILKILSITLQLFDISDVNIHHLHTNY